jgi:tetratricopeptide (TPR) repeat protein
MFGRKPKRPEDIVPEVKRHVVQLQETTGASYLAIAAPMLTFGISLLVRDKGVSGLASAIEILGSLIEQEQAKLGSLNSSIMGITLPEQSRDHYHSVIDKLGNLASYLVNQGYSFEAVGAAMASVAGDIAKAIDKNNLLAIALLRKEYERRRDEYKREQLRQSASGERCTEESINILLQAEAEGFTLTVEKDRTFVLEKESFGSNYLRSNAEIERFGRQMKRQQEAEEAKRSPVERLAEQGHKYVQQQKLENAISSYSAALRIQPDNAELYFHRGVAWSNTYYNRGKNADDLKNAIDDYGRAIEIDPEYGEAYSQRAGLWSKQDQVAEAIEDYSKAIEKGHQVSSCYFCRALLYQSTGEVGKAIADFDKAIRTGDEEDQFMALMARGEAHSSWGNLDLAVADFTAAAAYYPQSPPGLYEQRATALRKLGRIREAIADFDQAIKAGSPLADARLVADIYDQRGQCRMQLGESDLARQDFERAEQSKRQNHQ